MVLAEKACSSVRLLVLVVRGLECCRLTGGTRRQRSARERSGNKTVWHVWV